MEEVVKQSHFLVKEKTLAIIKYFVLIGHSFVSIYPFIWVVFTSLRTNTEIYTNPFGLPSTLEFQNYSIAFVGANVTRSLFNSLLCSFSATFVVLLLSSMTAYILSRINRSMLLYIFFVLGIMIPIHSILIPLVAIFKSMGILNTRLALIIAYVIGNLSFCVFILTSFMDTIPKEIEEAARIDGAGYISTFFRITFPIVKPGLATAGTFTFLFCWNDLILALLLAAKQDIQTLNLAAYNLSGLYSQEYGVICAGLTILIIPVMVIYMLLQEQVIKGLTAGAVKG